MKKSTRQIVAERLDGLMKATPSLGTQMKVAKKTGIGQTTIGRIRRGEVNATSENLKAIADAFGVTIGYLHGEELSSGIQIEEVDKSDRNFDQNVKHVPIGAREIPVISAIQAGKLKEISDPYPPGAGFAKVYTDDMNLSRWTFALEIEGDSMLPEFQAGDRVIIDPEIHPSPGDFVAARNSHEEATFKKYRPRGLDKNGNMVFELVPLNEDYPIMRSDTETLEIIGVMAYHIRARRRK